MRDLSDPMGEEERAATQCAGKHPYPTFHKADEVARRQTKKNERDVFNAYHCDVCDKFHVGSDPMRRRKESKLVPIETDEEREEMEWLSLRNTWL